MRSPAPGRVRRRRSTPPHARPRSTRSSATTGRYEPGRSSERAISAAGGRGGPRPRQRSARARRGSCPCGRACHATPIHGLGRRRLEPPSPEPAAAAPDCQAFARPALRRPRRTQLGGLVLGPTASTVYSSSGTTIRSAQFVTPVAFVDRTTGPYGIFGQDGSVTEQIGDVPADWTPAGDEREAGAARQPWSRTRCSSSCRQTQRPGRGRHRLVEGVAAAVSPARPRRSGVRTGRSVLTRLPVPSDLAGHPASTTSPVDATATGTHR